MMKGMNLRFLAMLVILTCLPGCMRSCYNGEVGVLQELRKIQNPTQVANDLWLKLIAGHFTNESQVYLFCFADKEVWREKPGSDILRHVYAQARNERHVRVAPIEDAKYILGVEIRQEPEGKKVVFTLKVVGEEGEKVVHSTTLAEPSLSQ